MFFFTRTPTKRPRHALAETPAVLSRIADYLDTPTLLSAIRVNSTWYDATIPSLYRELTFHPNSPFHHGLTICLEDRDILRRSKNLRYCRTLRLYDHPVCHPASHPLELYENLRQLDHLELAGGGLKSLDPADGPLCSSDSCPIVLACRNITKLTIRSLRGSQAILPTLPSLQHITFILRPCQLPDLNNPRMALALPGIFPFPIPTFDPKTSISGEKVPFHAYKDILVPLAAATKITVVLWDEQHHHRPEQYGVRELRGGAFVFQTGQFFNMPPLPRPIKGCACDLGFAVGRPAQEKLKAFMRAISKWTRVERLELANWERTWGGFDQDVESIGDPEGDLQDAVIAGRNEALEQQGRGGGGDQDSEEDNVDLVLIDQDRVAREYYTDDEVEQVYWDLLYRPSPRILELREAVSPMYPRYWQMLELWTEEELVRIGQWQGPRC